MSSEINRNPRRWVDASRRVRVIEGWHPSDPSRVGYNLMLRDDWVGTFESLEDAVAEACTSPGVRDGIVLMPEVGPRLL